MLTRLTKSFLSSYNTLVSHDKSYPFGFIKYVIRSKHGADWSGRIAGQIPGLVHLNDPTLSKGLCFTIEERQMLGIHGLLPPRYKTQDEQINVCRLSVEALTHNLNKFMYLYELRERSEKLFFRLLAENIESLMPVVYTPTVGLACEKFGLIYRRPRGLFITIHDMGHVLHVLRNWPERDIRAIVVTDGERILGLGDLGANGMGIPVGKLALYTALAGIMPHQCLPITLDVGTNNDKLLEDPLYLGLRHKRVTGEKYYQFVDEFMQAVAKLFGPTTLIQFEDFANHHAFVLLEKYIDSYCTFNDDIQGTASVAVAGILAAQRITGLQSKDNTYVFLGAGEAALGIASLVVNAMVLEGLPEQEAKSRIWMMDIDGLLTTSRPMEKYNSHQKNFIKDAKPTKSLLEVVKNVKPTALIGASASAGAFTPEILQTMAELNKRPVIYALSNPTIKAECTAEQAYQHTKGTCVFASGSPFPPVNYEGKTYKTGQGNNAYIFPGVALGVIASGMRIIPNEVFLRAAEAIAAEVSEQDLKDGSIYPPLKDIRKCSMKIAVQVSEYAYRKSLATMYPEPKNKEAYIESLTYTFAYENILPITYNWPAEATTTK